MFADGANLAEHPNGNHYCDDCEAPEATPCPGCGGPIESRYTETSGLEVKFQDSDWQPVLNSMVVVKGDDCEYWHPACKAAG